MANIVLNTSNVTTIKYVKNGTTTNITELKYKKGSGTTTSVWSSTPDLPPELGISYNMVDNGSYFAITVTLSRSKPNATSGSFEIVPYGQAVLDWGNGATTYSTGNLISFGNSTSVSKTVNINKNIIRTAGFKITGSDNFMSAEKIGEFPIEIIEDYYDYECPQIESVSCRYLYSGGSEKTRISGYLLGAYSYETTITLACFDTNGTQLGSTTVARDPEESSGYVIDLPAWYGGKTLMLRIVGVTFDDPNIFIYDMREDDDQFYYTYVETQFVCKTSQKLADPTITLTWSYDYNDDGTGHNREDNCLYLDIKDNNTNIYNIRAGYTIKSGTSTSSVTDEKDRSTFLNSGEQTRISTRIADRKAGYAEVYVSKAGFTSSSTVTAITSGWEDSSDTNT